jgi:drug/metabolite transporter (DMT)-like permease
MSYLTVLLAALLGWLMWDEVPDRYAVVGAILIFASALLVMWTHPKQSLAIVD